jgi:hypothetical protein
MTRFATVSAIALAAMSGQAFADVTPQQVWDDIETYLQGYGYEMAATETASGNGLSVTGISVTIPIPEEEATATVNMPDMMLTDAGNGTVDITLPETSAYVVDLADEGEEPSATITVGMTQSGVVINVSGVPDDMTYTYAGESLALSLDGIEAEDEDIPADVVRAAISMGPLAGTANLKRAEGMQTVAQDLSYGTISYDMAFNDPESDDNAMFKGTLADVKVTGDTTVPMNVSYEDPEELFAAGLAVDASITHAGGQTEFAAVDGSDNVSGQFSSSGGELTLGVSGSAVNYALSAKDQSIQMMVPDMPFPLVLDAAEFGMGLEMPLAPGDGAQPAGISVVLADFTMADMLWGIFDPGAVLPRDPATISVALDAMVTPFVNLLDAEAMETLEATGGVPGEINSLTISDFEVTAAGASITGTGDFTFDNADLETYDGMPRPDGAINLQVAGVNGLIDNLIKMGIVQEQDAMGARMMLGMFTVPGSAPDTATSKIEFGEGGTISANGQRIK